MVPPSSGSVLVSVNTQLSWVQTSVKLATGGWLSGGGVPPPSPHAEASTSAAVTAANVRIDRIESSQPKSDEGPTGVDGTDARGLHARTPAACARAVPIARRPTALPVSNTQQSMPHTPRSLAHS